MDGVVASLVLYSRPGCRLCDEMKAVVRRVATRVPLVFEEIDISADAALEARYGVDIPVLLVNGSKAAKHRVAEGELMKILAGRAGAPGKAGR